MQKKKLDSMENLVLKTLKNNGELGFRVLFEKVSQPKRYYDRIGSKGSLSITLKSLMEKGLIQRGYITRKYRLTNNGEIMIGKLAVAEAILSSRYLDTYSPDWRSEFSYIFIDGENGCSPNAISVAHERLAQQGISWENAVDKALESLNLKYESPKGLWDTLFKGVKRIIIVQTLEPWPLFEKVKATLTKKEVDEGVKA